jgi:predicted nucleotide-binding protein
MGRYRRQIEILQKKKNEAESILRAYPYLLSANDVMPWATSTLAILLNVFGEGHTTVRLFANSVNAFSTSAIKEGENHAVFVTLDQLLDSAIDYLNILDEDESISPVRTTSKKVKNRKIFVVHGQNEEYKNQVEEFLRSIELEPIILHKQPDRGRTIIEKIENADVSFAVIILTKDDFGTHLSSKDLEEGIRRNIKEPSDIRTKEEYLDFASSLAKGTAKTILQSLKPRARQNVVFEFGFFIGRLGRENVHMLYQNGVELPSDVQGLLYTPLDPDGSWRQKLTSELIAAGMEVTLQAVSETPKR